MRAVLVAGVVAALILLALANLSISAPSRPSVSGAATPAPIVAPVAFSFAIVSRVDDVSL
jgi:hypothetical protein